MEKKQKSGISAAAVRKAFFIALAVAAMALFIRAVFPQLLPLLRRGNVTEIEAYLQQTNPMASILFLALMQMFQVASVVIPAMPIHIAAGVVLNLLPGFLLCWASFSAANLIVFVVIRRLGAETRERARRFVEEGKSAALLRKLMDTGNAGLFVVIANIVPFLPNGIIPYAAALTDLSEAQFVFAVALGSALPTMADCALGDAVLGGNAWLTVIIFGALFAAAGILYRERRRIAVLLAKLPKH